MNNENNNVKYCKRCVSNTTIPGISFDNEGICNFCKIYDRLDKKYSLINSGNDLNKLFNKLKKEGAGKKYDCIVSISGGTDSTFCVYLVNKYNLRPLLVNFDNHWNSKIAEKNIKKIVDVYNYDFRKISVDFDEFKDLQTSFLTASVPDAEIPTDIGVLGATYRVAAEENIGYIINGHSFRLEGLTPLIWSNIDGKYIKSVQNKFGRKKLKSFPNLTLLDIIYFTLIKRIKIIHPLNYIDYNKEEAKKILEKEIGWEYYGGHHLESIYTKWVTNNLLPKKFGIDKRIIEYSAYVRSGQMKREAALEKLKEPIIYDKNLTDYVIMKLGISYEDYMNIMKEEKKTFKNYSTYYPFYKVLIPFIKIVSNINIFGDLGHTFVEKYSTY